MKKILLLLCAVLFLFSAILPSKVIAQDNHINMKNSFYVSYGVLPITDLWGVVLVIGTVGILDIEALNSYGSASIGYSRYLNEWFSIGGQYAANYSYAYYTQGDEKGTIDALFNSIQLTAKFDWLRKDIVTLYSKIGLGALVLSSIQDKGEEDASPLSYSFQLSPIGIELGRKNAGFLEIGLGTVALIQAGYRLRF